MKKEDIINILNSYNFNKDEFIILSGAALVLYGIKDKTNDIDITVSKELYNELLNKYNCKKKFEGVYFIDDIINFGTNYNNVDYNNYLGFKVQTINSILKLKKDLNRDKDIEDIKKIKEYLKGL